MSRPLPLKTVAALRPARVAREEGVFFCKDFFDGGKCPYFLLYSFHPFHPRHCRKTLDVCWQGWLTDPLPPLASPTKFNHEKFILPPRPPRLPAQSRYEPGTNSSLFVG